MRLLLPLLCLCTGMLMGPRVVSAAASQADVRAVLAHHATLVHASYADTLAAARALQREVDAFVAAPSQAGLQAVRRAWLAAREPYGQTEAYRFYGGPIDGRAGPEGRLNAWPMDEAYVDGVDGRPAVGIVNDRRHTLTKAALARLNERGGEENIATGWHAIEFLLWGQDLSADGPGARGHRDFVDGGAPNADRRRRYLSVVTELLVDDLATLERAWAPGAGNYRARFERGGRESLRRLLRGIEALSRDELAGERLQAALASRDQEDEQSCFSDNTHRDIAANARGVQNVWLGRWRRADGTVVEGPSPRDLVAAVDAALAERVTDQVAASVAAAEALPPPFDRTIAAAPEADGPRRVGALIEGLRRQGASIAAAAKVFAARPTAR